MVLMHCFYLAVLINEFKKKNTKEVVNDFKVSFRCKIHYMFDMFIHQSRALTMGGTSDITHTKLSYT